jgi:hypothetical protein
MRRSEGASRLPASRGEQARQRALDAGKMTVAVEISWEVIEMPVATQ